MMGKDSTPSPPTMTRQPRVDGEEFQKRRSYIAPIPEAEGPDIGIRRRSSTLTDFSIDDARRTFKSLTDETLLPTVSLHGKSSVLEPSHWHSAPLAFALFPAIGGLLFKNGSSVITDIMLLGLAAIFLNWSVRLPWEWYQSAQTIRELEQYNQEAVIESETEDENQHEASRVSQGDQEEDQCPTPKPPKSKPASHEAASKELHTHELLALLSCFLSPLAGTYLLHTIRSQLSRPSEGLVSNYNLTIFLLAAELRPLSHLVKLVQSRTLHLQRIVSTNPHNREASASMVADLTARLLQLETRNNIVPAANGNDTRGAISVKQINSISSSIRQTLQPELDALNRAVRRYEKRATLQTMQTDSRLSDLESRLNDAISLAAAAANGNLNSPSFVGRFFKWLGLGLVLPFQGLASLAALPFKTLTSLIAYGKGVTGRKESVDVRSRKSIGLKSPGYKGTTRSFKKV